VSFICAPLWCRLGVSSTGLVRQRSESSGTTPPCVPRVRGPVLVSDSSGGCVLVVLSVDMLPRRPVMWFGSRAIFASRCQASCLYWGVGHLRGDIVLLCLWLVSWGWDVLNSMGRFVGVDPRGGADNWPRGARPNRESGRRSGDFRFCRTIPPWGQMVLRASEIGCEPGLDPAHRALKLRW